MEETLNSMNRMLDDLKGKGESISNSWTELIKHITVIHASILGLAIGLISGTNSEIQKVLGFSLSFFLIAIVLGCAILYYQMIFNRDQLVRDAAYEYNTTHIPDLKVSAEEKNLFEIASSLEKLPRYLYSSFYEYDSKNPEQSNVLKEMIEKVGPYQAKLPSRFIYRTNDYSWLNLLILGNINRLNSYFLWLSLAGIVLMLIHVLTRINF